MNDVKKQDQVQLEIKLDEEIAQGVYANMAVINHTGGEFLIDMIFVQPQQPKAKVRSRTIMSPKGAKMLLGALAAAVENYESEHGAIAVEAMEAVEEGGFH